MNLSLQSFKVNAQVGAEDRCWLTLLPLLFLGNAATGDLVTVVLGNCSSFSSLVGCFRGRVSESRVEERFRRRRRLACLLLVLGYARVQLQIATRT